MILFFWVLFFSTLLISYTQRRRTGTLAEALRKKNQQWINESNWGEYSPTDALSFYSLLIEFLIECFLWCYVT